MRYTIITLASAISFASAQSLVPVGENCTPGGTLCALGANCYATNSGLQTRCGNFQASCTRDEQCAFNTCNLAQGLCNGFLASSSALSPASASTTTAPGFMPAPSPTIVAPAGSLPLGANCNPFVNPSQCSGGAQCWASNSGLIARCGNFNAACSSDTQCAYNACNGGLCRGFLPSSAMNVRPSSSMNATMTTQPTGTGAGRPTGGPTATTTGVPVFTGAASVGNVAGGIMAVVFGAVAWVL